MARVQEIYEILVQTTGTAEIKELAAELNRANTNLKATQQQFKNSGAGIGAAANNMRRMGDAANAASRAQKQFGLAAQNAGYQVSDFFVQVAGGTSAFRALGQQLPQLLQGFGLLGVGIATGVAALAAVGPLLSATAFDAEAAARQIDSYAASLNRIREASKAAAVGLDVLTAKYGDDAKKVEEFLEATENYQRKRGLLNEEQSIQALTDSFNDMTLAVKELDAARDLLRGFQDQASKGIVDDATLRRQERAFETAARKILEPFKATETELRQIVNRVQGLTDAIQAGDLSGYSQNLVVITNEMQKLGLEDADVQKLLDSLFGLGEQLVKNAEAANAFTRQQQALKQASRDTRLELEKQQAAAQIEYFADVGGLREANDILQEQVESIQSGTDALDAQTKAQQRLLAAQTLSKAIAEEWSTDQLDAYLAEQQRAIELQAALQDALFNSKVEADRLARAMGGVSSSNGPLRTQVSILRDQRDALKEGADAAEAAAIAQHKLNVAETARAGIEAGDSPELIGERIKLLREQMELNKEISALTDAQRDRDRATRGGGGKSAIEEQTDDWNRFVDSLNRFRTPAEQAIVDLRKLQEEGAKFTDQLNKSPEALAAYERGIKQLEETISGLAEVQEAVSEILANSLTSAFDAVIERTESVTDAIENMLSTILQDVAKFLVQRQIRSLINIFGQLAGQAGGFDFFNTPVFSPQSASLVPTPSAPVDTTAQAVARFAAPVLSPFEYSGGAYVTPQLNRQSAGTGGVTVNVQNYGNDDVQVQERRSPDGTTLDIIIAKKMSDMINSGVVDGPMSSAYGVKRRTR